MIRLLLVSICCVLYLPLSAQYQWQAEFGKPTLDEKALMVYEKDAEAAGVVLYEKGENYFEEVNRTIKLMKKVHVRMKVFDAKRFDATEVAIYLYHNNNSFEKVNNLKAVTINGDVETYVSGNTIFEVDETERWKAKKFTFPNVKNGSILEYIYTIETPYFFNFDDWNFQGKLPKIYSEFESKIPGNFKYKRELIGTQKLFINELKLLKHCFGIEGNSTSIADCDHGIYAMKDVPAYKEESYMLSEKNYISSMKYELSQTIDFSGNKTYYTKSWKDVDKEFRTDKDLGKQLRKNNFFEDKIPANVLSISNPLEKAKAIYYNIQSHFNWNGNYAILSDIRVKDAYEQRKGNSSEINLSLINALTVAGLDAKVMLLSTRNNGIPSYSYPVMTDFNYAIAVVTIEDQNYLLDATEKQAPFEVLPFRDLNVKGRVMDFKNGSFWMDIEPYKRNLHYVNAKMEAQDDDTFTVTVNEATTGHLSIAKRQRAAQLDKNILLKEKESKMRNAIIETLSFENASDLKSTLKTNYTASIETELVGDKVYLYPFFFDRYFSENPFTAPKRDFPLDFGYPISNNYLLSIDLKDKYKVSQLPESKKITLPEDTGSCIAVYEENNGVIQIRFHLKLDEYRFTAAGYSVVQEFFATAIQLQNEVPIVLEKR